VLVTAAQEACSIDKVFSDVAPMDETSLIRINNGKTDVLEKNFMGWF
jgi:hypothetical protein